MSTFGSVLNLSALNGSNGFQINGEAANDNSGRSVASAGDVNGDGFDDLIIGAVYADPNGINNSGASYVVFGTAGGFAADLNLSTLNGSNGFQINGEAASDNSGYSVASAGDVNGDGFGDLIIGAFSADPNGLSNSGATYVVFGAEGGFAANLNLSTLNGTNGFRMNGEAAGDYSGVSVASAGDVNGDGFDDLIIAATGADPNFIDRSGATYLAFGKAGGFAANLNLSTLNGPNGFQINGEAEDDFAGQSVASAGDVNGDGFDDLIIGSFADPNTRLNSGATYVVFGKTDGFAANLNLSTLNGTNGFRINGEAAVDNSGRSVASAGDINGDGFDDLIIGAETADPNSLNASGASYVVFGAAGGFAANLNLSALNGVNGFQINGEAANDRSGGSVASAGDVNGDGFDDLIIGARYADPNGLSGSGASYVIFGKATRATAGADSLRGHDGAETLSGLDGNDSLFGMGGNDQLVGGAGADVLDGGAGSDMMYGGAGDDVFIMDSIFDRIFDASGTDEVRASFSLFLTDAAFATFENAELQGSGNVDLTGNSGANVLTGNSGNNFILGGAGADTMVGKGGLDTLSYAGSTAGVNINLASNTASGGDAAGDVISGFEGVVGSAFADTLTGGAGAESITGGAGRDVLAGGLGNDVFIFEAMADTSVNANTTDVIMDFRRGQDKIDLSTIDAISASGLDDAFLFRGTAAFGTNAAGEIRFQQVNNAGTRNDFTLVFLDTDADRTAEGVIKVMGLQSFTAADFIL